MGWPLPNSAGGGSWLYHFDDNLVSVGFVVHLNYENPTLSPFDEFQRFKTHPMIRDMFEGGKRIGYGARAIMEGGWQSVPRLTFPGGCLVGDSAGFVNVPRIKGSHNAILSGMLCAEHVFAALAGRARERRGVGLRGGLALDARSARTCSGCATSSRCGRGSARWSASALGGLDMWLNELFGWSPFGTMRHGKPDHATLKPLVEVKPIVYPKPDGVLTFDRLSSVFLSNTNHEEDQPSHLKVKDTELQKRSGARRLRRPARSATARPAFTSGSRTASGAALPDQRPELRPLQNLRHQGPEPEHQLGHARGRRRAELRRICELDEVSTRAGRR